MHYQTHLFAREALDRNSIEVLELNEFEPVVLSMNAEGKAGGWTHGTLLLLP